MKTLLLAVFLSLNSMLCFSQEKAGYETVITMPKVSAFAFLPDIHIVEDSLRIDYNSGNINTFGAEYNSKIFETNEKYLEFLNKRELSEAINYEREEMENEIKDFATIKFLIAPDGSSAGFTLIKPIDNKSINLEIIRVFKGLKKIIPPSGQTKKNVWTLVTCRIYLDISPIRRYKEKMLTPIQKINPKQLQILPAGDNTISCELGKK